MSTEGAWEIADTIGDRAQDWPGVDNTLYGEGDTPHVVIVRGGARYRVEVRPENQEETR